MKVSELELVMKLRYGEFPDGLEWHKNDKMDFILTNFMWDLIYSYWTILDFYNIQFPIQEADKAIYYYFNNNSSTRKLLEDIDTVNRTLGFKNLKKIKKHFYRWALIAEGIYE
jgi:hypothetical protein